MAAIQPQPTVATRSLHMTNPHMRGGDVEHLQQLLTAGRFGNFHPGVIDGEYGPLTAAAVRQATWAVGFPEGELDGVADARLLHYLSGEPLPLDFHARAAARRYDAARALAVREQIVLNARWGIAHDRQIHYRQTRPMDGLHEPRKLPLYTDCSGFVTLCYAWAGAPDPNGLAYSGTGYTGTLLQTMRRIPKSGVQPGDLVVWGPGTGRHVALVLEGGPDPALASLGQDRGPVAVPYSAETRYQPNPTTWLSLLP
jgi:peptidoglycan hydrolase-like protein with peptidoglycan-binding domain